MQGKKIKLKNEAHQTSYQFAITTLALPSMFIEGRRKKNKKKITKTNKTSNGNRIEAKRAEHQHSIKNSALNHSPKQAIKLNRNPAMKKIEKKNS